MLKHFSCCTFFYGNHGTLYILHKKLSMNCDLENSLTNLDEYCEHLFNVESDHMPSLNCLKGLETTGLDAYVR